MDRSELEAALAATTGRLRRVEDEQAIVSAVYQYGHAINAGDRELWLDVFTQDGSWAARSASDAPWKFEIDGRDALAEWFDGNARRWPVGSMVHTNSSPRVAIDGDRAEARTFYLTMLRGNGRPALRSTGIYVDQLVRCEDGRWRICERRATGSLSDGGPDSEARELERYRTV